MPTGFRIVYVINFVKKLFSGVCFVFIYLFVYAIVKVMIWGVWSVLFASMITLLNELAIMHGQVCAICAALIFFKDEESASIQ